MTSQRFITVTSEWARQRLKSPVSRLFTQPFIQTQIKENIKAPRHWPWCGEFTGTGEFPAQRASNAENVSIWWRHHGQWYLSHRRWVEMITSTQKLWSPKHYGACVPIEYSMSSIRRMICEVLCQKQVSRGGTSNSISQHLWDVITCPVLDTCSWHDTIDIFFEPYKDWRWYFTVIKSM